MADVVALGLAAAGGAVLAGALLWPRRQAGPSADGKARVKWTTAWRIAEIPKATVLARDVEGVDVPDGTRLLVEGRVDPELLGRCEVKQVSGARVECAIARDGSRALVFPGGVRPGAWALWTDDPQLLGRLATEAKTLNDRASDYMERISVGAAAKRIGVTVETNGTVQSAVAFHGRFLMRLEDSGDVLGVLVDKDPAELVDEHVQVKGRMERDRSGFPVLEATDVRLMA